LNQKDAKLIYLQEWKREKERFLEERNRILLESLNKKLENSTQFREQNLVEENILKARALAGKSYLKKANLKNK